ncbi:MAG: acetoacetate--CoA ligase [Cyclobacteriaceae bacterium]
MPNLKSKTLWSPSDKFIQNSNLKSFERWLNQTRQLSFEDYNHLWQWSIDDVDEFWMACWEYFDIQYSGSFDHAITKNEMPGSDWFEGTYLNYAEHVFRNSNRSRPALTYLEEGGNPINWSWDKLETSTLQFRNYLIRNGIEEGDRVVAYLPNIAEAIVAFLAVNSLGAVWSCCSPDFGVDTVIDRFSQIAPKVLIGKPSYPYNGKQHDRSNELTQIINGLNSLECVVMIDGLSHSGYDSWSEIMKEPTTGSLSFQRVTFDHPIWILYSSGTTGIPKAITHSHGGVLLEHLKYHKFHNDTQTGENFFWFTTTGWMMWNFLQASMLVGGIPILYNGSPGFPSLNRLWDLADTLPIHHFGTSAPFLTACMKKGLSPNTQNKFNELRSIGSTGAPLPPEVFDWVYEHISNNVWLCSMSGGTDICTAFVGGVPYLPVTKGRIQGRALGCALKSYDEDGIDQFDALGEMVIEKPMPSMPIYFWNDQDMKRYKSSYFEAYPGKWTHGDNVEISKDGSLIIQGRSDATLNRNGIRIGTAEIYNVVDEIDGIEDCLIVNMEQSNGEDFMPLFVVTSGNVAFDHLSQQIKHQLKIKCSPRHIPDQVVQVDDIPYTLSGKKMEVPVKKILMGRDIQKSINKDATRNPEALDFFINWKPS